MRLIVNGKAAADADLRSAVATLRERGQCVEVRVTWEAGDASRFAEEAVGAGVDTIVAAGGDGTVNEVVNGVLASDNPLRSAIAVLPYGTANDFATCCGVPVGDPLAALCLAAGGDAVPIDVGQANGRFFINVASGGFGAEVTTNTPPGLKKAIGGGAYALMGVVTAAKMSPYQCRLTLPDGAVHDGAVLVVAVGNGRQCGGGQQVAPRAVLDDGLLDLMVVHDVDLSSFGDVLGELLKLGDESNRYASYSQLAGFEIDCEAGIQFNLDGEPVRSTRFEFKVLPKAVRFVLPPGAPLGGA